MGTGFGFRVSGFGFRVSGFEFRVSGFGFRGSGYHLGGGHAQLARVGLVQTLVHQHFPLCHLVRPAIVVWGFRFSVFRYRVSGLSVDDEVCSV